MAEDILDSWEELDDNQVSFTRFHYLNEIIFLKKSSAIAMAM